jgi:hypothetical protein
VQAKSRSSRLMRLVHQRSGQPTLMILRIAATGAMTNYASVSLRGCSLRLDDTEFIGGDDGKRTV